MPFPHTCFGAPGGGHRRVGRVLVVGLVIFWLVAPGSPASARAEPDGSSTAFDVADPALVPVAVALASSNAEALEVEARVRRERAGMVCPVLAPIWFYDDFGNPRSGGRDHEGNDLMSAHGEPVVAVVDGAVDFKSGSRQGRGAYLRGVDGNEYWYFHLSDYEGEPRNVRQGDVIGYTGETGNAGGTHTHFEIHPLWDPYEVTNPYPRLDLVCTDRLPMH
jgi:peptidoglycan LD-endopeptidase LytH